MKPNYPSDQDIETELDKILKKIPWYKKIWYAIKLRFIKKYFLCEVDDLDV